VRFFQARVAGESHGNFQRVTEAFYCVNTNLAVTIDEHDSLELNQGDTLLVSKSLPAKETAITFNNQNDITANVIRASVYD